MAENKKARIPMKLLDMEERRRTFNEVALGYTEEEAVLEAGRCMGCRDHPCTEGCPVNVKIPEFLDHIARHEFEDAYQVIRSTNSLPAVCGRVCPQENQCEGKCLRGKKGEPVAIGRLERFSADWHVSHTENSTATIFPMPEREKVAIIGAGPAGLSCAGDLAKLGYRVTVFELLHGAGGVLLYGIPEFRLPKAVVAREAEELQRMGVEIVTNAVIGKAISIDELLNEEGYSAVFIGTGAGLPRFMNIPGENLLGVYSANEYLTRINLMKAYREEYDTPIKHHKRVAVIGAGNVAMDAARCALRLGAEEVAIVYRRSMEEVPARREEVAHAMEEGITFHLLTGPMEILGDEKGYVTGMRCLKMELGEPDESGRRSPMPVEDSDFTIPCDAVIDALGTTPNPLIRSTTEGLDADRRGCILADKDGRTSKDGVFAGGDAVTGSATVILAMGAGKTAASAIDRYIREKNGK